MKPKTKNKKPFKYRRKWKGYDPNKAHPGSDKKQCTGMWDLDGKLIVSF